MKQIYTHLCNYKSNYKIILIKNANYLKINKNKKSPAKKILTRDKTGKESFRV